MLSNTLELDTGLNRLAFEKIGVILGIFLLLRNQLRTYQSDFRAVDGSFYSSSTCNHIYRYRSSLSIFKNDLVAGYNHFALDH